MATAVEKWVEEMAQLCKPDKIYWCDGSEEEAHRLIEIGMTQENINGNPIFTKLDQKEWPNSYYHRSHPSDVARTEHLTFICRKDKESIGPTNNWMDPDEAKRKLEPLFDGCMKGRTMYVMPYMMGHPDSPYAKACVQITDISYVVISMRIMTRMSKSVLDKIGNSDNFVRGVHSIGNLDPENRYIMHFPDENLVWSIGSGYGGNALLGKKCFSLRIASWLGLKEGWLAEHMALIGVEDPQGKITYMAVAMPSACGKTNLAMLESTLPGYKVWTLGDDIAWLNVGDDGQLYAINPEAGYFGVAPGTSMKTNGNMLKALKKGTFFPTLFTNTALDTDKNEPWWEGLGTPAPAHALDWQGNEWDPSKTSKAAHANSRFTVSAQHTTNLAKEYSDPKGVPISAIILGGRRANTVPLLVEAFNWQHGVFIGARSGSETTAAAIGQEGVIRRDPMAMIPFCGYNMGDYFAHWLQVGKNIKKAPKIYSVNWFRLDDEGKFIWPGFGDNIRVLKWIIDRINGKVGAKETPIGLLPNLNELSLEGLDISSARMEKLLEVNPSEWVKEAADIEAFLTQFGAKLPEALAQELKSLKANLS